MKWFLSALLVLVVGCAGPETEAPAAEAYLFPRYKLIREPAFVFTKSERQSAIRECWKMQAEILYEVIVDAEGKVVRIRVTRPWRGDDKDRYFTDRFLHMTRREKFEPGIATSYRTFFYAVDLEEVRQHPDD